MNFRFVDTIICKSCSKHFKRSSLLKHISQSESCNQTYSCQEKSNLSNTSEANKKANKRKSYNPCMRHQRYARGVGGDCKARIELSVPDEYVECMGCNYTFKKRSILKHIVNTANCKTLYYSDSMCAELDGIKRASEKRSNILKEKRLKKKAEDYSSNKLVDDAINEQSKKESIECKACKRHFKKNQVLWHISKSFQGNDFYSHSSMRKEREVIKFDRLQEIKKKQAESYSFHKLAEELTFDQPSNDFIECKVCERSFPENVILKHITKSVLCNGLYTKAPLKDEFTNLKKNCKKSCRQRINKRAVEGYALGREEEMRSMEMESLLRRKADIEKLPEELHKRAQKMNQDGLMRAKEKFELEFSRFKTATKSTEVQDKIKDLESLITDTNNMFEDDIERLSKKAKSIADEVIIESRSLQKAKNNLLDLYKPLIGTSSYCNEGERVYFIEKDWHDVRLRIDLVLYDAAKSIRIDYKWADTCDWLPILKRMCPKCNATKGLICKPQEYVNICTKKFIKEKEREIAKRTELRKKLKKEDRENENLIRKRKPIDFTIADLEAEAEEEEDQDFTEFFDPGDVF